MYKLVTKFEDLGDIVSDVQKYSSAGFDVESTGLDPFLDKVTLIQIKFGDNIYLVNTVKLGLGLSKYVCMLLKDNRTQLIGHNLSYDIKMIRSNFGEYLLNVYDTMVAEVMTTNGLNGVERYPSLKDVVLKYCQVELDKSVRENFIGNFSGEFTEQDYTYAALDVHYLQDIKRQQLTILESQKQIRALELENRLVPVVASMEFNGIKIDREKWLVLSADSKVHVEQLEKELKLQIADKIIESKKFNTAWEVVTTLKLVSKSGQTKKLQKELEQISDLSFIRNYIMDTMNLSSPSQMLAILSQIYNVPIENTNEKTMDKFLTSHPIIKTILDFREHKKKVDSFGEAMLENINNVTGRVHARFNQLGARTGRFSGSNPNLFNIPREQKYRDPFVAEPGFKIIATDFAQEELRLMASTFGITKMIEAFNSGIDLHTATASGLYGIPIEEVTKEQRSRGKTLNFAVGYGSTEFGLYKNFGIPRDEGKVLLKKFFEELYPEYTKFKEMAGKRILEQRWSTTLLGRKRFFEPAKTIYAGGYNEKEREESSIVREGINTIIQGTGADIIKESLVRLFLENPFGDKRFKVILQVYDEILVEVADEVVEEAQQFITSIMLETEQKYLRGIVKAEVDSKQGQSWLH